ncbi:MAG: DUF4832 domain-containing protein [Myxococcales bacterium]|nr:DUF4832 domain-containing protein [Myxococcales bacterium]
MYKDKLVATMLLLFLLGCATSVEPPNDEAAQRSYAPAYYDRGLRNPLKGFTTRDPGEVHEWATLAHEYFRWNELENHESDGLDEILRVTDEAFGDVRSRNVKVIPRVYLHWDGDQTHWPSDMTTGDYDSPQFKARVTRLVERLGQAWNDDPRVAFVEMGIFGKWGEHHSPDPTWEMQQLVGEAFVKAFPDKKVSVRSPWEEFQEFDFGVYWDSWAHQQQMYGSGRHIDEINTLTERWKTNYVGGEVAYNWGDWQIQPGETPTDSVDDPTHRNFIENSIRWLHCTQLKWIDRYDQNDQGAREGAEILHRALGYRLVLTHVHFTPSILDGVLELDVFGKNEGSAPFYYDWPIQVALHDPDSREVIWSANTRSLEASGEGEEFGVQGFRGDMRSWWPGFQWTEPEFVPSDGWPGQVVSEGWSSSPGQWNNSPTGRIGGKVRIEGVPDGEYVLSLSVLDPGNMEPNLRFATTQYWNGGWHPLGRVSVGGPRSGGDLDGLSFDDPGSDLSIRY